MDVRSQREAQRSTFAAVFLGSMMMLVGVGMIITHLLYPSGEGIFKTQDGAFGYISRGILVLGGLIILIYHRKGNYFAVGIYAIILGVSRIIRSFPGLTGENDFGFYASLVFIAIGVNLVVSGYNHLTVRTKNPIMMRVTAIAMLCMYAVGLLYVIINKMDFPSTISSAADMLWYAPLYISLIVILSSREILDNVPMGRIKRYSMAISDTVYLGDHITVSPEDAETIKAGLKDTNGWLERDVAGMHVSETKISFLTEAGDRDVILGKVSGKGGLVVSVIGDSTDSFVTGKRFKIQGFKESDGVLELYDGKGICAVLKVGGDE